MQSIEKAGNMEKMKLDAALDAAITRAATIIILAVRALKFHPEFKYLESPEGLTWAGVVRFREAQRDKAVAHYEACAKAEREFVEGELRKVCDKAAFVIGEDWTPTAENINALPEPLRRYIHDVETRCDPSGLVQENTVLKDTVAALERRVEELEREAKIVDGLRGKEQPDAGVTATE